jgi:hypothetical protein
MVLSLLSSQHFEMIPIVSDFFNIKNNDDEKDDDDDNTILI